jgi:CRP-like cAMP-binding protein
MSRKTLPLDVRKQLQATATPLLKDKDTVLFQMGQPCCGAFLIRSGQVQLSLDTVSSSYPARTVGPGFVVGLPATFSGEPYSLTAETKSKCHVDFIPRQKLSSVLHQNPDARFQILRLLSEEIFHMRKLVNNGGRSSSMSPRVA